MKISLVTSLYNSSEYIDKFYQRAKETLQKITNDFEIIFVNDCSPDNSLVVALNIYNKDQSHLRIIDLSINSGQHKALLTGLRYATGDLIFMMDSDLEEDPELMEIFWREYSNSKEDIDVIYGIQSSRKGTWFEQWSGKLFYKMFNLLSPINSSMNPTPFRLMTKRYVDAIIEFKEREVFFLGISLLTGFNQKSLLIEKHNSSPSSYNFFKKINQFVNAITSFSNKPLTFIFYFGGIISMMAFFYLLIILFQYFFLGFRVAGWTSLVVSIWLVGGIIIFCLGIIGIYLSKIFIEVKNRPYTIIKKIYE